MTPRAMIWIFVSTTVLMVGAMFIRPSFTTHIVFDKALAERDIRSGMVKLITFGLGGPSRESNAIASKYGFEEWHMGCVVSYTSGEKEYTELVTLYLNKRNGANWRKKYYNELDSLESGEDRQQLNK